MQLTDEQQAIDDFIADEKGSLIIEALAGSGKSTALIKGLERIKQRSILLCAFNKRIADELQTKLPKMPPGYLVNVKTFHAQGLLMLREHFRVTVDTAATEELINRAAGQSISFNMRRAAVRLLRIVKETYADEVPPTQNHLLAIGLEYSLFDKLNDLETSLCVELTGDAYLLSLDFSNRTAVDYCDMVWAPVVLDLKPKARYQAILCDELQDTSAPQLTMLRKLLAPNGRLIAVGDVRQQIYQFRGSMGAAAWEVIEKELGAKRLPLTTTWRCASSIVAEAQALVPSIKPRPGAPVGLIQKCSWEGLPIALSSKEDTLDQGIHSFVLSRNNATLLDCALYLWRSKVRFELNAGKELFDPLISVIDNRLDLRDTNRFHVSLTKWEQTEMARAEKANATAYADRVEEQAMMLRVAASYAPPSRIKGLLLDILTPNGAGVLLSTVHKVKGLEAQRVFLLKQTFGRHKELVCRTCEGSGQAGQAACDSCGGCGFFKKEPEPEEKNLEYVAITRAINRLIWVDINDRGIVKAAYAAVDANAS